MFLRLLEDFIPRAEPPFEIGIDYSSKDISLTFLDAGLFFAIFLLFFGADGKGVINLGSS